MIEHFWSQKPTSFSLDDLKDLNIDESKEQKTGCGGFPGNTTGDLWDAGFRYPLNGEFDWDKDLGGECWTCTNNWGEECFDAGAGGRGGRRGKIKRTAFKGEKLSCCVNNIKNPGDHKIEGDYTCDPNYRKPTSEDCNLEINKFCGDYNRIINDDRCYALQNSHPQLFNALMKAHCNWSDDNAKGDKCIDWCRNNSTDCSRLNTMNDCATYELKGDKCNAQAVLDIKNKCKTTGILSEQGLQKGSYQCTPAGIDQLEKDCKKYKMSSCTVDGIDQAQITKQQKELSDKALKASKKQFEYTQKALAQVIDLPTAPTGLSKTASKKKPITPSKISSKIPSKTAPQSDNSTTYIIIFIVILCLLVLSSSSLAVFAMKKK
jgi:hypothetical protein